MTTIFEKETRRFVRPDVKTYEIVDLLKSKYVIRGEDQKTVFDLYFRESPQLPPDTKVREESGRLIPTLKIPVKSPVGVFLRDEITDVNKICSDLGIKPVNSEEQLLKEMDERYGRAFIVEQNRTLVYLIGTEVSIDRVNFHRVTNAPIPPIRNALGETFHTANIYEAEGMPDPQFMYYVTEYLSSKGLLGAVCEERKEEIGRRVLAEGRIPPRH